MPAWIPNVITIGRLISVPIFVALLLNGDRTAAVWVFVAAGVSDAVDGFLAKRFDAASKLGAFLDPVADKALLLAAFMTLGLLGEAPLWLVAAVVLRDIVIVGGALLYHSVTQALTMEPLAVSKLNTLVQIALAAAILARLGLDWNSGPVETMLIYAAAATTTVSGGAYIWIWGRRYAAFERQEGK
ncbi:CDP-alcohol phosphatidyltransferase family protein [Algihabitans albus]|uniref:CDP-alcohol phosphatidyltransferase family protein n=1 Tax=Algihabitans albus TaxID=2164067 RepID=UPI000E5CBDD8|nr:CDP-alcohol phosphatidyltransferase family protein [Algihabitans albus]